ncbi:bifunctional lysylphosphatidylglycerol flippase/synthetase MprF [Myxococcota bacterium]|nr:bifunctional lysylphosphatidylglycerol flippase/synthetase MprF [Myxococcota bacterium]
MSDFLLRIVRPLVGLVLFAIALVALDHQLHDQTLGIVIDKLRAIPASVLAIALVLTAASYATLTLNDLLGLRHAGRRLPHSRTMLTSFIAYVFSMDLGLTVVGSSAIRFRLYSIWGLSPADVAQVVGFTSFTFFVGILGVGGPLWTGIALPLPDILHLPIETTRPLGGVLLAAAAIYLIWRVSGERLMSIRGFELTAPSLQNTAAAFVVAAMDWFLAAGVLFTLLPSAPGLDLLTFVAIFMACQLLGLLSTVPAGLGVFEGIAVALLAPFLPAAEVLASLVAWRILYYLLPVFVAIFFLAAIESLQRRESLIRLRDLASQVGPAIVPRLLAVGVLVMGLLLVITGAFPTAPSHAGLLGSVVQGPWVGIPHMVSIVVGLGLVLLARGIQQRVDVTYALVLGLLGLGSVAVLLRGSHVLLTVGLVALFVSLLPCRSFFYRTASWAPLSIPREWLVLISMALLGVMWLGFWADRNLSEAQGLLPRVGSPAEFATAQRAALVALVVFMGYGVWRLTRPGGAAPGPAGIEELERAARIVEKSPHASSHLALLGDKSFLFSEGDEGLLMYGVAGRSWVSMGDPMGPPEVRSELAWQLRELSDRQGGWPVFYEVGPSELPLYLDLGLSLHKLGEEGRVMLSGFDLEGSSRKGLRQTRRRAERDGCSMEVIPKQDVTSSMDELARVSEAWLGGKNTREKRFSLGAFDPGYLERMPVAVVRVDGRIVAFANLWLGADKREVSPDLMRFSPENSPSGVMEYLFVELMLWAKEAGYEQFNLGMAPLTGLSDHRLAPAWSRVGTLLFRHGEHFYNFQGLRRYKEKFDPVWEARYLASPSGLGLPRALAHVSALVSGGFRGIVAR